MPRFIGFVQQGDVFVLGLQVGKGGTVLRSGLSGVQVEQATEHTDPKSILASGSSLMFMKFMLPRDSSPIFPL